MEHNLKTQNEVITIATDLGEFYRRLIDKLITEMNELEGRGSGWALIRVKSLELRINKYNPLRVASYVDLPKWIKDKKSVINVKNEDNECFR